MDITLIIKSVMGLIVLLSILIFILFNPFAKKKKPKAKPKVKQATKQKIDMNTLRAIIKKRNSSTKELQEALDLIIKHHGTVHKKLGTRTHPDFDIYMDILFTICRHKNTTKDLILSFDKSLAKLNPAYKQEINEAMTKGLNSRV